MVNRNERRYTEDQLKKLESHLAFVHSKDQKWKEGGGYHIDPSTIMGCVVDSRLLHSRGPVPSYTILQVRVKWLRETPRGYFVTPTSSGTISDGFVNVSNLDHFVVSAQSAFKHASSI